MTPRIEKWKSQMEKTEEEKVRYAHQNGEMEETNGEG